MRKFFIALTLFFISYTAFAVEETLLLRAGFSIGKGTIQSNNVQFQSDDTTEKIKDDDNLNHYGVNTQFAYKWINWELIAASHITFSSVENLHFRAGEDRFYGSGSYKNVTINPAIKYLTPFEPIKNWRFYSSLGPIWSIGTIKFDKFEGTKALDSSNFKLAYESFGGTLSLGIEEQLPYKEMHPVYLEITFFATKSYKVSVVDTSDFKRVNILSDQWSEDDIENFGAVISMGITLF